MLETPLHKNQPAYQKGKSTETALHCTRVQSGTFKNTSLGNGRGYFFR